MVWPLVWRKCSNAPTTSSRSVLSDYEYCRQQCMHRPHTPHSLGSLTYSTLRTCPMLPTSTQTLVSVPNVSGCILCVLDVIFIVIGSWLTCFATLHREWHPSWYEGYVKLQPRVERSENWGGHAVVGTKRGSSCKSQWTKTPNSGFPQTFESNCG